MRRSIFLVLIPIFASCMFFGPSNGITVTNNTGSSITITEISGFCDSPSNETLVMNASKKYTNEANTIGEEQIVGFSIGAASYSIHSGYIQDYNNVTIIIGTNVFTVEAAGVTIYSGTY